MQFEKRGTDKNFFGPKINTLTLFNKLSDSMLAIITHISNIS